MTMTRMTMTLQEIYDETCRYAKVMPRKAAEGDVCQYRVFDKDGSVVNCCFVGHFVPDYDYDPVLEGSLINGNSMLQHILAKADVLPKAVEERRLHVSLLSLLQSVHDHCDKGNWHRELLGVAEDMEQYYNVVLSTHILTGENHELHTDDC